MVFGLARICFYRRLSESYSLIGVTEALFDVREQIERFSIVNIGGIESTRNLLEVSTLKQCIELVILREPEDGRKGDTKDQNGTAPGHRVQVTGTV